MVENVSIALNSTHAKLYFSNKCMQAESMITYKVQVCLSVFKKPLNFSEIQILSPNLKSINKKYNDIG